MTSADQCKRISREAVNRSEAFFGDAIEIMRPQMAAKLVHVLPMIPERFEIAEIQIFPPLLAYLLIHQQRDEHRAGRSPSQPAQVADFRLDSGIEPPREIFGR